MPETDIITIGIDPGTAILGYGVIAGDGDARLLDYGVFETAKEREMPDRLVTLYDAVTRLIAEYDPHEVADGRPVGRAEAVRPCGERNARSCAPRHSPDVHRAGRAGGRAHRAHRTGAGGRRRHPRGGGRPR